MHASIAVGAVSQIESQQTTELVSVGPASRFILAKVRRVNHGCVVVDGWFVATVKTELVENVVVVGARRWNATSQLVEAFLAVFNASLLVSADLINVLEQAFDSSRSGALEYMQGLFPRQMTWTQFVGFHERFEQ